MSDILTDIEIKINPRSFTAALNQTRKDKHAADDFCDAIAYAIAYSFENRIDEEIMTSNNTSTAIDDDSFDFKEWARMIKRAKHEEVKVLVFNLNTERKIRALEEMRDSYIVFGNEGPDILLAEECI